MTSYLDDDWDMDGTDTPFRARAARLGDRAGVGALGASLYEIDPGGAVSPYHTHEANEELLIVVAGTPSLRTPAGVRELATGDIVGFATGADGAHRVFNRSDAPARVLIVSTTRFPDVAEHVDTGTRLVLTGPGAGHIYPDGVEGEWQELMAAALSRAAEIEA